MQLQWSGDVSPTKIIQKYLRNFVYAERFDQATLEGIALAMAVGVGFQVDCVHSLSLIAIPRVFKVIETSFVHYPVTNILF